MQSITTGLVGRIARLLLAASLSSTLWQSTPAWARTQAERDQASKDLASLWGPDESRIQARSPTTIEHLLRDGADPNYGAREGNTPMSFASWVGDLETLELFSRYHANFNVADSNGYTPLMEAIINNKVDAVELLLKLGARIQDRPHTGSTALILAAGGAIDESIKPESQSDFRVARSLIEHGALINERGAYNRTPLMMAACNEQAAVVKFFLRSAADLEARDDYGFTALAVAADRNLPDIIEILVDSGAKIEAENKLSETPLTLATRVGALEAARTLIGLRAKIDPNVTSIALTQIKDNQYREDPYPWISEGNADRPTHIRATVKYMIEHGAPKPTAELAKYLEIKRSKRSQD